MSVDAPSTRFRPRGGLVRRLVLAVLSCPGLVAPALAQEPGWGFSSNAGFGDVGGGFGRALHKAETGEFAILRSSGPWRYGLGLSFGSFAMKPPHQDEPEWGFQRISVSGTRVFSAERPLRPYLMGRAGIVRLHPRSELFALDSLPPDFKVGDSPTRASNGVHVGLAPGLEWSLSPVLALDLSVLLDYFRVGNTDLSPVGAGTASSGFDWQARMGLVWWAGPGGATPGEPDAWGVPASYAWGVGETFAINLGASAFNEYVRNANFNQISLRSWRRNATLGFTYDDNEFTTNQFIHPFNGSQYFNAARSNGIPFWPSYGIALAGALHWELAGETHPMSFNDLISTGIGGAALGEAQYRFSSMMLDNEATGARRLFREAASFVVDPIRGLNRVVSGRAWRVHANPANPADANPLYQQNQLDLGWRRAADGPSLGRNTTDTGFLRYQHEHGHVFRNERRRPFDFFTFDGQIHLGDKSPLGRLLLSGNWWTAPIGDGARLRHMAAITQHFEYFNSQAFEFGGQSVGASVFSRWGTVGPASFHTRFDLLASLLSAVNSEYAGLAAVADSERTREYDYGPGGGSRARLQVMHGGRPMFSVSHALHFLYVTNGSVYHRENAPYGIGLDAVHWLNSFDFRFDAPPIRSLGLGIEYTRFTRESHYKITSSVLIADPNVSITQFVKQTNPEVRVFLRYCPSPAS